MNAKLLQAVQKEAEAVRAWAENRARAEAFPDDLCGLCARSAGQMFIKLQNIEGLESQLCFNTGHAFCRIREAGSRRWWIVDVTATQFYGDYPPVYITNNQRSCGNWRVNHKFIDLQSAIDFQRKKWHRACIYRPDNPSCQCIAADQGGY